METLETERESIILKLSMCIQEHKIILEEYIRQDRRKRAADNTKRELNKRLKVIDGKIENFNQNENVNMEINKFKLNIYSYCFFLSHVKSLNSFFL